MGAFYSPVLKIAGNFFLGNSEARSLKNDNIKTSMMTTELIQNGMDH